MFYCCYHFEYQEAKSMAWHRPHKRASLPHNSMAESIKLTSWYLSSISYKTTNVIMGLCHHVFI